MHQRMVHVLLMSLTVKRVLFLDKCTGIKMDTIAYKGSVMVAWYSPFKRV